MLKHLYKQGFQAAAEKKFWLLEQKEIFTSVNQLQEPKKQVLLLKQVFTYKFDQNRYLAKYKTRIYICRNLQKSSTKNTYAATLAVQVFRALIAITAAYNLEAKQLDAVNAFINSAINKEVYCKCLSGYKNIGLCLLLLQALYRLQRSPKLWYNEFA